MTVMGKVEFHERGPTPRRLRKSMTAAKKGSWFDTAAHWHTQFRKRRFTKAWARVARYTKRSRKYERRKEAIYGHKNPLEYTGETKRAVRQARITSTSKGNRIRYIGARKLNFRNPNSKVRAAEEFRRIPAGEARELAGVLNRRLDKRLAADQSTTTKRVR